MRTWLLLGATSLCAAGPLSDIVEKVNSGNHGWTAAETDRFGSFEDVKKLCGTWLKGHEKYMDSMFGLAEADINPLSDEDIPASFDAREEWPECTVIASVRDQSACGSCWAFGSTEAFSGSRCIATGEDIFFSPEDTAGCCKGIFCGMSQGCNGGQPGAALKWMTRKGVVTGGNYEDLNSADGGCKPYSLAPCAHHVPPSDKYPACPDGEYSLRCKTSCTNSETDKDYSSDKTKGTTASSLRTVKGIQTHLMTVGPVVAAFSVYEDFPTYKSGVYKHVEGSFLGGHAVEIVGWGATAVGQKYWVVKNSWNEQWGDGGFFKIAMDECGISDQVNGISFDGAQAAPKKVVA